MTPNRDVILAIEGEYLRYKKLAEEAMAQVADNVLFVAPPGDGNSIAIIVAHLAGNLKSRFTEFLTTDGEKPWRKRDEEFEAQRIARDEMMRNWVGGWRCVLDTLDLLDDGHLSRTITIRSQPLSVGEALLRSLAHTTYHVGQIVLLAKSARADEWKSLSIPKGQSEQYNKAPTGEKPPARL